MARFKKDLFRGSGALLLASTLLIGQAKAATVVAGGDVPVINTLSAFGNPGIDVTVAGTAVIVASFIINNNTPNGFSLNIGLANGGRFAKVGTIATGVDWTASTLVAAGTQPTGSVLGAGSTAVTGTVTLGPAGTAAPAAATWANVVQTTATTNYKVNLTATWAANATLLAGNYTEIITASLTAIL